MKKISLFISVLFAFSAVVRSQPIPLTGTAYTQDFNTLSNVAASTTNNLSIPGWQLIESGLGARDNDQYAVDNGSFNTGDTYSFGATAATERALGSVRSGTLISSFGAGFINNTGTTLNQFRVAYTGEQWRLGTAGRTDRLDFQYSIDATDIITGTWIDVNSLDFQSPNIATVGAKDGNAVGNRTDLVVDVTGISIAPGATFFIRWLDFDASSADDGLAIDDFTITTAISVVPVVLRSFNAVRSGNDVKLSWASEQETNLQSFHLQRQLPGNNRWETVDSIGATGLAHSYHAIDVNPGSGPLFYRLQMIDHDGSFAYSGIVNIKAFAQQELTVYPSPATSHLNLQARNSTFSKVTIAVKNIAGQMMLEKQLLFNGQSARLDVSKLKAGIYIITVTDAKAVTVSQRFIKK